MSVQGFSLRQIDYVYDWIRANRPKYTDYRAQHQQRAGLEDKTTDYLAAYKYGSDLIRKLATMK